MDEAEVRTLSYRDAQKQCKALGLSAKGKTGDLHDKLIEHYSSNAPSEVTEMERTPIHDPGAENLPPPGQVLSTPGSEKRRVVAQKAIGLATQTPLPAQFEVMASPAPKPAASKPAKVVKRSRGGCGLVLMFLLSSAFTATVCMYTYRIKWGPVIKKGKEDVQAGFKEYTRQAQALGEMDYADFLSTKEKLTVKAKALYAEYSQKIQDYVSDLSAPDASGGSTRSVDNTCQAAINGFEITFTAPTRTFASEAEVHSKAVFKFLLDLSNVHHRFKSITHLVEYPDTQEAGPTVTNAMRVLGCEGTLSGQCMAIDFEVLAARGDQGAALQAQVAPQLKMSPSTIFFIQNIEYLDPSGAAVLLALVGEHGVLNQPSCDISTQSSAALIFVPTDVSEVIDVTATLEDFEATLANNIAILASGIAAGTGPDDEDGVQVDDAIMKESETTAAALRRRVSEHVLRTKAIGDEGIIEGDEKLSEKAASARAVSKPSPEEVETAQRLRREAAEAQARASQSTDAKEL